MKTTSGEQLRAMIDYILGPTAKESVVRKMAGDMAALIVADNVGEMERLLRSDSRQAQEAAAVALHLCGAPAARVRSDFARLLDHPSDYVRRLASELIKNHADPC